MAAWAAPAAVAATPNSAGSNARPPVSPATAKPAAESPTVSCTKPGTSHSIQVAADLSGTTVSGKWNKSDPTKVIFDITAEPKLSLKLNFSGDAECQADLTLVKFPIGDTGLILELGPKLDFSTTGEIGADFTWKPTIEAGFTINHTKFSTGPTHFTNGTGIVLTGEGTATMRLDLRAVIETVGGVAGVDGDFGPTITAKVHGSTADDSACWNASVTADADFGTYVSAFGFTAKFSHEWQLGQLTPFSGCLAKTIIFDGTPGTKAPPNKLGPYTMTAFAPDETAQGTAESKITGPTGPVAASPALTHDLVGSDWQTWSNSYSEGDVYEDETVLPDGNIQVTLTLPAGTGAFYAYVEPNTFSDYAINATANNGVTSGDVTVDGDAGAKYFGFYATCGHTVNSVTYIDSGGDSAVALGEFGIAKATAC